MADEEDAPIKAVDYLHSQVVDLEGVRISRGIAQRKAPAPGECQHKHMTYDLHERRVWCEDCETTIPAFDAFMRLVGWWQKITDSLKRRADYVATAEQTSLISRAAKAMDDAWRRRKLAPCCPHCRGALLPDDFADGVKSSASAELERARRKATARRAAVTEGRDG
jgi:hypothetical protein